MFNTNRKIDIAFQWSRFCGFSYLFDPKNGLDHSGNGFPTLRNRPGVDSLYDELDSVLSGPWGTQLRQEFLLCRIPFEAFHVTVMDGINDDNLRLLTPPLDEEFRAVFQRFPQSWSKQADWMPSDHFPLRAGRKWRVQFKFRELILWRRSVLVARLKPADEASRTTLGKIESARKKLGREWNIRCGLPLPKATEEFIPHITLGYFPNVDIAGLAEPRIPSWTVELSNKLLDGRVAFTSIGLYAFTDMTRFLRKTSPTRT